MEEILPAVLTENEFEIKKNHTYEQCISALSGIRSIKFSCAVHFVDLSSKD